MKKNKGSLSVETAMFLPIFLVLCIALFSAVEMLFTYEHMQYALHETARELAFDSYAFEIIKNSPKISEYTNEYVLNESDEDNNDILGEISEIAFTETSIRALLIKNYGYENLNNSIICNKAAGIRLFRSDVGNRDDTIDLIVTYDVKPWINIFKIGNITMVNRAAVHAWTGYSYRADYDEEYVYVTPNGQVYHTNRDCTYLHLSIDTVSITDLEKLRNKDGKIYDKCRLCGNDDKDLYFVYVTDYGESYHTSLSCNGLKRTILKIKRSETGGRTLCKRCREYMRGVQKKEENDGD